MSYASLSDLKLALRITDVDDDTLLQVALDAADSAIDAHCNRTFSFVDAVTARTFEYEGNRIDVDDIATASGLIVAFGATVVPALVVGVSGGYRLLPRNALVLNEPYTAIEYCWANAPAPTWPTLLLGAHREATISAKWGFATATPTVVKQASLLQASRIFARRQSPYGVAGSPELGSELRLLSKVDPDVAVMLSGMVRYR